MKRTLALLLALMMVLSVVPASALATDIPVTETPAIEAPAQAQPELLADEASLSIAQTSDGVVVTYTVPDMDAVADELSLYRYDSVSDRSKRVTHIEREDMEDWDGLTFTWFLDGSAFVEYGEGDYYCAAKDGSAKSNTIEFAYAADAQQLPMPANLTLNVDSLDITWESDDPVMAVVIRDDTSVILDYRRVFNGHTTVTELMEDITEDGLYVIALFAFSENDYVNNKPSEWAHVAYMLGSNPETDPDYPQDNPDALARYTRIQVADLLVSAFELEYDSEKMGDITYIDVTDPMDAQTAAIVHYYGFMVGSEDGSFYPDKYINRAKMAVILHRALNLPAGTSTPVDVTDEWSIDAISAVVDAGLMFVDEFDLFYPEEDANSDSVDLDRLHELASAPVTQNGYNRIQVANLLVDAFDLAYDSDTMGHISYIDVTNPADAQTVAIVDYYNFMVGDENGNFFPNKYIHRAKMAEILNRALNLPEGTTVPEDADDAEWRAAAVSAVLDAGLMTMDNDGYFHPNAMVTTEDVDLDRLYALATTPVAVGDCGPDLIWTMDFSTYVLTITGTGVMDDYDDTPWDDWCEQITAVSLPEGLTHLGDSALYKCSSLTEITLPSTLESIGSRAIAACHSLETLHLPANVTEIGSNALGFDVSLTEITVDPANTAFRVKDGFVLTADEKTLVVYPSGLAGTVILPDGITTISAYAFCGSDANAFILPDTLTTIMRGAFHGCSLLKSIEIPAGVAELGFQSFFSCGDLQTIIFLGDAPTTVDDRVFTYCHDDFRILYDPANAGWSTPEWNGWPAYPIGGTPVLPEAPAATNLQWNVGITSSGEKTASGWFSFYGTNGVDYAVNLYRQDDAGDNLILSKTATPVKGYYNVMPFNYEPTRCQTGDYYFTVQAMGDGSAYVDGPIQTSAVWHYTRPNAELVPTDLYWSVDKSMNWNLDETYVLEYHVGVLYNSTEDNLNGARMVDEDWYGTTETPVLSEELLAKHGTGWYYFAVQPITYDPTVTLTPADIFYSNGYYYYNASATLPEAPAATDLQWNTYRNSNGSSSRYQLGAISFGRQDTTTYQWFLVEFYRKEASVDVKIGEMFTDLPQGRSYRSLYPFERLDDVFTTGTYYFTVTTLDERNVPISQPVRSGDWTYSRPNVKLGVSNVRWGNSMVMKWDDAPQNDGYLDYYEVRYQYVPKGGTFYDDDWNYSTSYNPNDSDDYPYPPADLMGDRGDGDYYFQIRAISNDITEAVYSDWSDWSDPFEYTTPSTALTVSNLQWDGNILTWTPDFASDAPLAGYKIYVYESAGDAASDPRDWYDWVSAPADATIFIMPDWMLEDLMGGSYYFTVVTVSSNPAAASSNYGSAPGIQWTYQAPTTSAPEATDLQWNTNRNTNGSSSRYQLGTISFGRQDSTTEQNYRVEFYRKDGDVKIGELRTRMTEGRSYRNLFPFDEFDDVFTTGTYYFTVTALGDGITTADSQPVRSGDWTYTRPSVKLGVSNVRWSNKMSIKWDDAPQNDGYLDYYEVRYQYVPKGGTFENDRWDYGTSYHPRVNGNFPYPPVELMGDRGDGKYYFRVRAISNSINEAVYSDWSDWSDPFEYTTPSTALTVSNLQWDGNSLTWTPDFASDAPLAGYEIYVYESAGDAASDPRDWYEWVSAPVDATIFIMPDWMLEDLMGSSYYFTVVTVSSNPAAVSSNYGSAPGIQWTYQAPTTSAPEATDLQWDLWRWSANDYNQEPGAISFTCDVPQNTDRLEFEIKIYRREGNNSVHIGTTHTTMWADNSNDYTSLRPFEHFADKFTSGTYYFTVTSLGDGVTTCDSQPVTSPDWTYTRPAKQLTISNPEWNSDMSMEWTAGGTGEADYYRLQFQLVQPGDTFRADNWNDSTNYWPDEGKAVPSDWILKQGNGKVYFRVMAMSEDVNKVVPSGWSEWSQAFDYTMPSVTLKPTNLRWDNTTGEMLWDVNNGNLVDYYQVCFYYSDTPDRPSGHQRSTRFDLDEAPYTLPDWMIRDFGEGYYWFGVRVRSNDPTQALTTNDYIAVETPYYFAGADTPADAPVDLQWNLWRNAYGNNTQTEYGTISFARQNINAEQEFRTDFYRKDPSGDVHIGTLWAYLDGDQRYCNHYPFDEFAEEFTTGTYYFTITALGDGVTTCDGQPVRSGDWTYTHPGLTLVVSNPVWNSDMSIGWTDGAKNGNLVDYYSVQYRYVAPGETFDPNRGNTYGNGFTPNSGDDPYPHADMLLENGSGTYYFRMRARSEDIMQAVPSGWTDWSAGFTYIRPSTTLTVSNLQWNGNTLSWTPDFDPATAPLLKYWIYVYEDPDYVTSWPYNNQTRYLLEDTGATSFTLENWMMDDLEGRDWHFAVVTVPSDPTRANSNWGSAPTCRWTYTPPANKLGTPSELQWNVQYDTYWENGTVVQQTPFQRMGALSFRRADVDQNQYEAKIYRVGEDHPVQEMRWRYGSEDVSKYFSMPSFIYENHPSGQYYFTLRAYSDDINYGHGDWVDSRDYPDGVWTYGKPDDADKLGVATGLRWDDRTFTDHNGSDLIAARWFPVNDAGYYEVRMLFSPTKDGIPEEIYSNFDIRANNPNLHTILDEWAIAERGNGWYYFQVRAISGDITQTNNGEWSALSSPYPMGYVSEHVKDTVSSAKDLVENASTAQDKQAAVQTAVEAVAQLPQLNAVLSADTDNTQTVAELKALEEKVADVLNVTIEQPDIKDAALAQKMDVNDIQISNMALNVDTTSTAERSVQLTIDAVDETTAPPALNETLYKNTVEFSMKIEGAVDADDDIPGHQLTVPVKMVLPIPAGINPDFLVVLHHKESDDKDSNGTWEEIHPYVYQEKGKWFATFVVDSFSNFSLAELSVTATATGSGTVEIAYNNLPEAGGQSGCYLLAVYSKDGQMLGMTMLNTAGNGTATIRIGTEKDPAYAKMMTVDSANGWIPLEGVLPIEIRK